ncbi:hypothetical protein [Streptomyces sp. NPDC058294]|uniref:hypothetical protein n=1 Tax=Streptomyces sp. NPDC058294 TaxID=3346430 RepID=UPI0036E9B11B
MATNSARKSGAAAVPVLGARALDRATLARQLLLLRSGRSALDTVGHLLGLQARNTRPPYYAPAARLHGFAPVRLSTSWPAAGSPVSSPCAPRSTPTPPTTASPCGSSSSRPACAKWAASAPV